MLPGARLTLSLLKLAALTAIRFDATHSAAERLGPISDLYNEPGAKETPALGYGWDIPSFKLVTWSRLSFRDVMRCYDT